MDTLVGPGWLVKQVWVGGGGGGHENGEEGVLCFYLYIYKLYLHGYGMNYCLNLCVNLCFESSS